MKSVVWVLVLAASAFALLALFVRASEEAQPVTTETLPAREEHWKPTNVDQRQRVGELFERADARAAEGKHDEAISLYQQGLQVDPWQLEYQLKLARLFEQIGLKEQAVEKAQVVSRYAEQEELIKAAQDLLAGLDAPRDDERPKESPPAAAEMEIVIVPIGKVNARMVSELRDALQAKLGIRFSIAEDALRLGLIDRTDAERSLTATIDSIKAGMPEKRYKRLLRRARLTEASLKDYDARVQLVVALLRDSGCAQSQIDEFYTVLAASQKTGQYDAAALLSKLSRARPLRPTGPVRGYLGITEADMFARDYNFLYGWGGRGHAVMSYRRFTAAFNQEPPNRPRLLERTVKQGISSTFYILDIPRCTSPTCARAYPHDLAEHDQKTSELCEGCKRELAWAIARIR